MNITFAGTNFYKMEETLAEKEKITEAVRFRMEKMETPASRIYEKLGITQNTFKVRLEKHTWKNGEIAILKQLEIL